MTKRINLQNTPDPTTVSRTPVSFVRDGVTLRGLLFAPVGVPGPLPGVVVTGAWTTVKEQMAGTYARALAAEGYAALVFDFTGWGESGGDDRHREDPQAKTADIHAAVDFLAGHGGVDSARVSGLGVCASAGYMTAAAADHPGLSRLALVAPWLHDPEMAAAIYGGKEQAAALIAAGDGGGSIVAASATDEGALMFQAPYYTEPDRGLIEAYDNRFSLSSWGPWLTYNALAAAARLSVPTLVICSEAAALPAGAHRLVAETQAPVTEQWLDDVNQFDFYDRADVVASSVAAIAAHLR